MKLENLSLLFTTETSDYSPLSKISTLRHLRLPKTSKSIESLRRLPFKSLLMSEVANGPPTEFWPAYDAWKAKQ